MDLATDKAVSPLFVFTSRVLIWELLPETINNTHLLLISDILIKLSLTEQIMWVLLNVDKIIQHKYLSEPQHSTEWWEVFIFLRKLQQIANAAKIVSSSSMSKTWLVQQVLTSMEVSTFSVWFLLKIYHSLKNL